MKVERGSLLATFLWICLFLLIATVAVYIIVVVVHKLNDQWPKKWTMAPASDRIYPNEPIRQETIPKERNKCSWLMDQIQGTLHHHHRNTSFQQHNHREVTPFQQLKRASQTGFAYNSNLKLNQKTIEDRKTLANFFQDTHHSDSDWVNDANKGGRTNWLDKDVEIGRWQGVTVYDEGEKHEGRVRKLQLPKNNIAGTMDALEGLTAIVKLSLWQNSINGSMQGVRTLTMLQQLDLSRNHLTGNLQPLSTLSALLDLNLGHNNIQGTLEPIGELSSVNRLVLCDNKLTGELHYLAPVFTLKVVDLSNNRELFGQLPPNLHKRWISGSLPFNTSGTKIGSSGVERSHHLAPLRTPMITSPPPRPSQPTTPTTTPTVTPPTTGRRTPTPNQLHLLQTILVQQQNFKRQSGGTNSRPTTPSTTPSITPAITPPTTGRPTTPAFNQLNVLKTILVQQQNFKRQSGGTNSRPTTPSMTPAITPPSTGRPTTPSQPRGSSTPSPNPKTVSFRTPSSNDLPLAITVISATSEDSDFHEED